MKAAFLLAFRDLRAEPLRVLAHALVFAIAIMATVTLGTHRLALQRDYGDPATAQLLVQESNSLAEFYGSRLNAEVGEVLLNLGITNAVSEIHGVVGTSVQNSVLIRGVDLGGYKDLVHYTLISGRALDSGDGPRQAMIGSRLAQRFNASVDEKIILRGRDFNVVGIFSTGDYIENEAWIPLQGAQQLLGWDDEVSLYVIPDEGVISAGDELLPGVSVVSRGDLWSTAEREWSSLFNLIEIVTRTLGMAAAFSLAAILWRMAWQRKWDMAVLRIIGFSPKIFMGYIVFQGLVVAISGGMIGFLAGFLLSQSVQVSYGVLALKAEMGLEPLLMSAAWLAGLGFLSIAIPLWAIRRKTLLKLLTG